MDTSQRSASGKDSTLIVVLGPTGCGKTTFINLASGSQLRVGHGLESCTADIEIAKCEVAGESVTLIDTPGFDDTEKPQADVLKQIATFLQKTYESKRKVTGVIYMHRITDIRMSGILKENFRLFRKICGADAMKNCVIVTSMWTGVNLPTGVSRENELRKNFFKDAISQGAKLTRHDNTEISAKTIVQQFLNKNPQVLHVQGEMVDEGKKIPDTDAGIELQKELEKLEKIHRQRMQNLRDEMTIMLAEIQRSHQEQMAELQKQYDNVQQDLNTSQEKLRRVQEEKKKIQDGVEQVLLEKIAAMVSQTAKPTYPHHSPPGSERGKAADLSGILCDSNPEPERIAAGITSTLHQSSQPSFGSPPMNRSISMAASSDNISGDRLRMAEGSEPRRQPSQLAPAPSHPSEQTQAKNKSDRAQDTHAESAKSKRPRGNIFERIFRRR